MPNPADRLLRNVPGPFYVDSSCIDCDFCRSLVPAVFRRDDETGGSFVHRQPETADEVAAAMEASERCPSESIGREEENRVASPAAKTATTLRASPA